MMTDHKLLVVIFKKVVASLSHRLQRILLWIHWYNIRMLYKPEPQLFIADWLSRNNNATNNNEKISAMYMTIKKRELYKDIPNCMKAEEIREATLEDENLMLWQSAYSTVGHPQN